jgi:hypothetical protein
MKYSLRSLMIVVTLLSVLFGGRIEYQRRWALYHEHMASIFKRDGFNHVHEYHEARALAHRQAMWRPWTVIDESQANLGASSPQTFTIRDGLVATVFVVLSVVWWVDRSRLAGRIRALELAGSAGPLGHT